jgi:hypothetical protein
MSNSNVITHDPDFLFPFVAFTDEDDAPLEQRFTSLLTRITHCYNLAEQLYALFGEMANRGAGTELLSRGDALAYALTTILSELPQEISDLQMAAEREAGQ